MEQKLTAPNMDRLLRFFHRGFMNAEIPSSSLCDAMDPLFLALSDLSPIKDNQEVKRIWLQLPRGDISDYDSFEDLLAWDEVSSWEEYETRWKTDYPEETAWYELIIVESYNQNGCLNYRGISVNDKMVISARMDRQEPLPSTQYREEPAIALCELLLIAAENSMKSLRSGSYND